MMMCLQVLKMVTREKRDNDNNINNNNCNNNNNISISNVCIIRPVHLKVGVALAISVGGIVYAYFTIRTKRTDRANRSSKRSKHHSAGKGKDSRGESGGDLRDDDLHFTDSSFEDRDGVLLPEFNELVKECHGALATATLSPKKYSDYGTYSNVHEMHLREQEREAKLELQLLEHCGNKHQETRAMELHNRLRLRNMTAKIHNLKIESLLSHNRKLEAQLAAYARLVTEHEAKKSKTKMMRNKLKSEAEQQKKHILTLQNRVMKLQEQDGISIELERYEAMRDLEDQLVELKRLNQELRQGNSDLLQRLEYVQVLARTALDSEEINEVKEENRCLKQQNEVLTKEIERAQADRWSDIEELVYLRWMNTCLQYELRNIMSSAGKALSGDANKTLSPKSEERCKQITPDGNTYKDGFMEKRMDITDADSDRTPSLQSSATDSGERDDSSVDRVSVDKQPSGSSKNKVLSKLKRMLTKKISSSSNKKQECKTTKLERAASEESLSVRFPSFSIFSASSCEDAVKSLRNSPSGSSRRSFELHRTYSPTQKSHSCNNSTRNSDASSSTITRVNSPSEIDDHNWLQGYPPPPPPPPQLWSRPPRQDAREELLKYAETLKAARAKTFRRRSTSSVSSQ